jgi:hypothetical protein
MVAQSLSVEMRVRDSVRSKAAMPPDARKVSDFPCDASQEIWGSAPNSDVTNGGIRRNQGQACVLRFSASASQPLFN